MKGFVGRAAKGYFSNIEGLLREGEECIKEGRELSKDLDLEPQNTGQVKSYQERARQLSNDLLGHISSSLVHVDDEMYYYVKEKQTATNSQMAEKILYVADTIEKLCQSEYQIPSVTPQIQSMIKELKKELMASTELSDETRRLISRFVADIDENDR